MNQDVFVTTRKKLAFIFAMLVFCISLILWSLFFTGKYLNIYDRDKKEFEHSTQNFLSLPQRNNRFFEREFIGGKYLNINKKPERWMELWMRFLNFIIFDEDGNILEENITQDIWDFSIEKVSFSWEIFSQGDLFIRWENLVIEWKKVSVLFLKPHMYGFWDYMKELFNFLLVNILFSFFFYFVWYIFTIKVLRPVEENIAEMNAFIHNAGHELKTPLSVVQSNLQLLQQMKSYESDLIENSVSEIHRMDELILGLSQLSDISSFSHQEKIVITESIESILQEYKQQIQEKNIIFTFEKNANPILYWNKSYFEILFSNLLSNAIKYNQRDGHISILLEKKYFSISNTGIMITPEQQEKIFDRFYRWDLSRTTQGFWIWLSLVKKICDIFWWKISVQTFENKNIFKIEW